MLRIVWRLLLGTFALMLAIPFGAFVLGAAVLSDPGLRGALGDLGVAALKTGAWSLVSELSPQSVIEAAARMTTALLTLIALPPVLAALIGETFRWASATWYWGTSALLTAMLPWTARDGLRAPLDQAAVQAALPNEGRLTAILFVGGAASGFVYWAIAGWSAGRRADPGLLPTVPARPRDAASP